MKPALLAEAKTPNAARATTGILITLKILNPSSAGFVSSVSKIAIESLFDDKDVGFGITDKITRAAVKNKRPVTMKGASYPPDWKTSPPKSGPTISPIPKNVSSDACQQISENDIN